MELVGANPRAKVVGLDQLPGKSNYFIGNDAKKWRTNVTNYAKVQYQNVYPGIDLVYYGNEGRLEYDFVVRPGADPKAIKLAVAASYPSTAARDGERKSNRARRSNLGDGTSPLQIDSNGDLVIAAGGGEVRFHKPVVYQAVAANYVRRMVGGDGTSPLQPSGAGLRGSSLVTHQSSLRLVDGRYSLNGNEISFELPSYDRKRPLTIDPVLSYSTYLGGSGLGGSQGNGIAVDSSGNAYVTGTTGSGFPTVNPVQTTGGIFVAKLKAAGSALIYSTYLGGSGGDSPAGIALDSSGDAYVTGHTCSADFPTTAGAFQSIFQGPMCNQGFGGDAFVVKLNAEGNALAYSTYLGGSAWDQAASIAVDSSGNAYLTGLTESGDFPMANALQASCPGAATGTCSGTFVTKLNATGTTLAYSTYLTGSSGGGQGSGIAVDSSGSAYVTGQASLGFPIVNSSPFDPGSCGDGAFVAKFTAQGTALAYSTYLGCASGTGIAVDSLADAYVTGSTSSTSFPTKNAIQPAKGGGNFDAFVTELDAAGTALVYSTYLGGSSFDEAFGIAVDSSGNAYVTGSTSSTDFPSTNSIQGGCGSTYGPAFVTEVGAAGSALVYSTCLGGSNNEIGIGIAVDALGNAYVTGLSGSNNFPTVNAFQPTCGGSCGADTFVSKIGPASASAVSLWPVALNFLDVVVNTQSYTQLTLRNMGSAALTISNLAISGADSGDFSVLANGCGASVSGASDCNLQIQFSPAAVGARTATLTINDNAINSPQLVPLSGTGIAPADFSVAVASGTSSIATVTAGGTATFTLSVSPLGGFNQTVMISCTVAPQVSLGPSCAVSPPSVTPNGTSAATATATLTTTAPTMSGPRGPFEMPLGGVRLRNPWFVLAGLLLLAVAATSSRRTSGKWALIPEASPASPVTDRRYSMRLALALVLGTLIIWSACGGGGGSSVTRSSGTPPGNYTITLKGTSGGLSHSTTVTLKVQ